MKLWSVVLVVALVVAAASLDPWLCGRTDTGGRTLPHGDIVVRLGQELRVQCELRPGVGYPDQMRFLRGADLVEPEFVQLNGSMLQLHVPNPLESSSTYYCKRMLPDGTFIDVCFNRVIVGVPPREVEDFSCESANWEELRCTWHAPHNYLTTRYNLTYLIPQRASRSIKFFCTNMTSDSVTGLHTCIWNKYTQPHYRRPYNKFLFNLTAVNALGGVSQSIPFDHYAHIRPNPPKNFKVIKKTTHGATLIWKIPSPLDELGPGLNRKLIYRSEYDESGDWTSVNVSHPIHNKTDYLFELTGLKYANVRYEVRLSLKPTVARDNMWSNFSSITFRTLGKLPRLSNSPKLISPKIDLQRHTPNCKRWLPNGTYIDMCYENVIVNTPPSEVEDFTCESTNWEELRCTWHAPHNYLHTSYNLTFLTPYPIDRHTQFPCTNMIFDITGLHTCIWNKYTQPQYCMSCNKNIFKLIATNALGITSQRFRFDHYAHIRPFPPENFKVTEKTTNGARLIWKIPRPLDQFGPGLDRKLIYRSEYAGPDEWTSVNVSLPVHNKTDYAYDLTELKYSNTSYEARLSLKSSLASDDMWSNFSSVTFRTLSELPPRRSK